MTRVPKVLVDPSSPQSIVDHLGRVQRIVDQQIDFGTPQDPRDPTSTAPADGIAHNGTIANMAGSWFQLQLDDATNLLNTDVTCIHNLGVQVVASRPNVLWSIKSIEHDGTGAGAGSVVTAVYSNGAVTTNSIQLRFFAAARTVTVAHPLLLTIWFEAR